MITTREGRSAAFSGRSVAGAPRRSPSVLAVAASLVLAAGCATEQDNSVARAARAREVGALRAERERLQRDLAVLRQSEGEAEQAIVAADAEAIRTGAKLRAVRADLRIELAKLQQAERDLAEAAARGVQIEAELQPLRALERQLAERDQRASALAAVILAKDVELATLQAKVAEQETAIGPRLLQLQQQLQKAQQFGATLAQVEQQLAAAIAALLPPAPATPPAAPANQPVAPAATGGPK